MDPSAYPAPVRPLLSAERLPELGPGQPHLAMRPALAALTVEALFGGTTVRRPELAQACLAGLWLLHDYLDESHSISQELAGADGSYWHGLMHRREPDYGNSAYWFRRVGRHPVFAALTQHAAKLTTEAGTPPGSEFLTRQADWDPFAFVDLCEAVTRGRVPCEHLCRLIQRAEWDLLFAHGYDNAR